MPVCAGALLSTNQYEGFKRLSDEDFMTEANAPAAKWKAEGDKLGGTVLYWEKNQRTDYDSGQPLVWDENAQKKTTADKCPQGKPLMQWVVTIQSEATGFTYEGLQYSRKELPDDDGKRSLYLHGAMKAAVVGAIRKAGGTGLESGAYIEITRTKDRKSDNPKYAPQHTHAVVWTPANRNSHATAQAAFNAPDPDAPADTDPWAKTDVPAEEPPW